ncbi:D-alanyl-D-alanine carboxypeptidase [Streptacidiphilus sp. MAP12-33]|uniref:serine hydrolase domain-containing protein n=1 Tax=Streptacidiphilus sp. MAP12-33 TaxID=3156266 RepID=UPI00351142FE
MHVFARRRHVLLGPAGLLAAVLIASAASVGSGGVASARPNSAAGRLQQEVDAIHDTGTVGVLAEVTWPGGRRAARAGTADTATGRPVPWDGRFRIGSATKTFTATVVLQLVSEGRLSLDESVEHWLPGVVHGNGNDGSRITVRELLQHTSGIPDIVGDIPALDTLAGYRADRLRSYTPTELVALALRHPAVVPVGTWSYSNTDYVLLGMIIKAVTGRSWAEEVHDRIIRPLGLTATTTPGTDPSVPGPHAHGYSAFGAATAVDVTELNPSALDASGSVISTVGDLGRFYRALLGGRLLRPAQLADMETTVPAPALGADYGLGIGRLPLSCGGFYYTHPGEVPGYWTWVGVTADGTRSAAVTVTGDGDARTQQAIGALVDSELCRAPVG